MRPSLLFDPGDIHQDQISVISTVDTDGRSPSFPRSDFTCPEKPEAIAVGATLLDDVGVGKITDNDGNNDGDSQEIGRDRMTP